MWKVLYWNEVLSSEHSVFAYMTQLQEIMFNFIYHYYHYSVSALCNSYYLKHIKCFSVIVTLLSVTQMFFWTREGSQIATTVVVVVGVIVTLFEKCLRLCQYATDSYKLRTHIRDIIPDRPTVLDFSRLFVLIS